MPFLIRLENLKFFARIGVFDFERENGNDFEVNVSLRVDSGSFVPESLDTTISYADVYEVVEEHMKREWLLLESVAKSIADTIKQNWPLCYDVAVKVTKIHPPIKGINGSCSVEYSD